MKKLLFLLLLLPTLCQAQFCGPYTTHAPVNLSGVSNQTISGYDITCGTGAGIHLYNCHNIHITKCYIHDGTTVDGMGIFAVNCTNITVDTCYFYSVATGLEAQNCVTVVYNYNHDKDMVGPYPRGQAVQFNNVSGAGNSITNNISWAEPGLSNYEDHINVYKSNGTAVSPIIVSNNKIYGGGPSTTGSGITVADQGGSYQTVTNNIVVNSGNIGMQVAGGTFITMSNNTIYGKATTISHLGLGYGNYIISHSPSTNITMANNTINWRSSKPADLAFYPHGTTVIQKDTSHQVGTVAPTGWSTNHTVAAIDSTVLTFPLWSSCVIPPTITYPISSRIYTYGIPQSIITPIIYGSSGVSFSINHTLPSGLTLNSTTGEISGTPTASSPLVSYTITATNSAGSSTFVISLTVNKAALVIKADNKSKTYNTSNPTLTLTYNGFLNGDSSSSLLTPPSVSTTAITSSIPGSYPITISGASSANYDISYVAGTLQVNAVNIGAKLPRRRAVY